MDQGSLFTVKRGPYGEEYRFDGETYEPEKDQARLGAQCERVFDLMRDGVWRSLREISDQTGDPEASISARLRDFRKQRFGGYTVERRRQGDGGTFQYRLVLG